MFELSAVQIIIVLLVALLVFGPKRLPELGRQLGKGMRELKGQVSQMADGFTGGDREETPAQGATAAPPTTTTVQAAADDDVLDGVVVSGASPPETPRSAG